MESCWFVGAKIKDPVADFSPSLANELWVVNHEYRLYGSPLTYFNHRRHRIHVYISPFTYKEALWGHWIQCTDLRSGVYRLDSGTSGPYISICYTGFAMQPWVTIAIRYARLSFLFKTHMYRNTENWHFNEIHKRVSSWWGHTLRAEQKPKRRQVMIRLVINCKWIAVYYVSFPLMTEKKKKKNDSSNLPALIGFWSLLLSSSFFKFEFCFCFPLGLYKIRIWRALS